ncbi:F-box domain protein [Aspergillus bombycis]|uniref:F-box domain protein n=1 Tax=Aspergillus bombycis TaxID=109264 RepID=A0A1F8AEU3_9EURO|nr:F-box domain protein [Aspergillus bombycis]OGM50222.1 F-box domain protein [Aspergillus bombycis]
MGILSSQGGLSSPAPGSYKTPMVAKREAFASDYANNVCWFDAEDDLESDDGSISPVSDPRQDRKSGNHWARFFPELSSHFSLVSPISTMTPATSLSLSSAETQHSTDPRPHADEVGQKAGSCSSSSPEGSSCYSRRSSATSLDSGSPGSTKKRADTFSVVSPADAGVFEDLASIRRPPSRPLVKKLSAAELRNKPLPLEPAIRLTPLSVRHKDPPKIRTSTSASPQSGKSRLSVAAEDLENTLSGFRADSPTIPLHLLNEPLQISRGKMEMIPSRPAPQPPTDMRQKRKVEAREDEKARKNKGAFNFHLSGFSRKYSHLHARSWSSPNMRSEAGSSAVCVPEDSDCKERKSKDDMAGLPSFPNPNQILEPLSQSIERELRMQLPRLQVKGTKTACSPIQEIEPSTEKEAIQRPEKVEASQRQKSPDQVIFKEKFFVSSSKITVSVSNNVSHQMDIAELPEMVYELDGGAPESQRKPTISDYLPTLPMPGNLPDKVVLAFLRQVRCLHNVPSRVGTTRNEPAMEYRMQILVDPDTPVPEYTPALYLQRYAQDIYTLAQLKLLILTRCETFLRQETIRGLTGKDDACAKEIDDALWRIWTFCRIFGCGKSREGDVVGQVDWLNGGAMAVSDRKHGATASVTEPFGMHDILFEPPTGFGHGNKGGLSNDQLYYMTEIWTCLGVLLQPIHGRCKEAREAGIFAGHQVAEQDNARAAGVLEEWTYYVLTLGPSAVLNMAWTGPGGCAATLRRAQSIGLTKWDYSESGVSRSSFLKEAVSKAYKSRCESPCQWPPRKSEDGFPSSSNNTSSPSSANTRAAQLQLENERRRQAAYADQLRNQPRRPMNAGPTRFRRTPHLKILIHHEPP